MPIREEVQRSVQNKATQKSIEKRLTSAGIKVQSGKKAPKKGEFSGIISNSKRVLKLKF
ncbi:hypothetical protein [Lentibacillus juripiscarius]|uniref:Uncharacterized protein n=1 Tax=Lentibacillus juripiscarius TaxID=257446 RepID=A0ABW5V4F4_9BACI